MRRGEGTGTCLVEGRDVCCVHKDEVGATIHVKRRKEVVGKLETATYRVRQRARCRWRLQEREAFQEPQRYLPDTDAGTRSLRSRRWGSCAAVSHA